MMDRRWDMAVANLRRLHRGESLRAAVRAGLGWARPLGRAGRRPARDRAGRAVRRRLHLRRSPAPPGENRPPPGYGVTHGTRWGGYLCGAASRRRLRTIP
jgi:hypothetical protein